MLNTCFCIYQLMYTFLDSAMHLHNKTQYIFFERRYTFQQQIITTLRVHILLFCLGQNISSKIFLCYFLFVHKKDGQFIQCALLFLSGSCYQFCTSNCRAVFNFLQFQTALSSSFRQFVKKFDNLSSAFRCSYDIKSTFSCSSSGR